MIEIINLCKSFNGHQVLKNLNLTIKKGQTQVIIGRSGCGKSVLLKHIVGLLKPDLGQVIIDNQDITQVSDKELNQLRLRMGLLFQGAALFDSLSVGENVGFILREHTQVDEVTINKKVKESLELVGLKGIEELMPSELSGGMKKRVGLARAICARPDIILYGEPTTGVDPIMADGINTLIRQLHDKLQVTSIAVTHDMVSAYKISDQISMLYDGRIVESGTPEKIKNSQDPIVRQFISGAAHGPITE
ncbi:MAG: ABC transporter ATP-binding protein [Candidatus Omnitrophica bacterium]|nr:ABC transporter ATP-binding protein [Candidatus Omnitrophota bacterium]